MRGTILAVAFIVFAATIARADEWCGYATGANAMIACGYSSVAECQSAIGKGATCFVDPDYALIIKRTTPGQPIPAIDPASDRNRS